MDLISRIFLIVNDKLEPLTLKWGYDDQQDMKEYENPININQIKERQGNNDKEMKLMENKIAL